MVAARRGLADGIGAAWMLAKREWIRFFRQRNRVTAAIAQPLLFWLLFGTGLKGSFSGCRRTRFHAVLLAGNGCLDCAVYRDLFHDLGDRGSSRRVHAVGVGRAGGALARIAGQGAWWFGDRVGAGGRVPVAGVRGGNGAGPVATLLPLLVLLALMAVAMCSLGMIVAWPMDSTQGFHAIMMLGLMPMWLLSGSFFPIPELGADAGVGQWLLGGIMRVNPLSYSMVEMRRLLYPTDRSCRWICSAPAVVLERDDWPLLC